MAIEDVLKRLNEEIHVKWAFMKTANLEEAFKILRLADAKNICYHEEQIIETATMKVVENVYVTEFDIPRFLWHEVARKLNLEEIRGYWM